MKIFRFLVSFLLIGFLVVFVFADEFNPLIYQYTDPEVTVVFSNPLEVSGPRQREIADTIAGIEPNPSLIHNAEPPENIICTLFGHDIAPEVSVTATHHKVNEYNPRCLMEVYHVTYCKRCDYTVAELVNSFFIICCPED